MQDIYFTIPDRDPEDGQTADEKTKDILTVHFKGKVNTPYERCVFRSMTQNEQETVQQYIVRLRHQAELRDFDREDEQFRDHIIEKRQSHQLRIRLLHKGKDLTLDQLCAIAQTPKTIEHNPSAVNAVILCEENNIEFTPDFVNKEIVNIILNASATLPKSNFNKYAKPHWSAKVKESYTRALRLRNEWFKAGRPKGHSTYFLAYKEAKTAFRRTERRARESHDNCIFDQLSRAAEVDYKTFWKLLRQKSGKQFNNCSKIVVGNQGFENTNVAEGFKEYFAQVFDYVNTDDLLYDTLNKELVHYMNTESSPLLKTLTRQFSIEEVEKAVHSLSKRKSPGHDGILNEHIIYAGHSVVKMLRILFNAMLKYEKVPTQWQTSILIPIYKGKGKSRSDPESYRPVSLIPCFSKLFEKLLLSRVNTYISATKIEFPC